MRHPASPGHLSHRRRVTKGCPGPAGRPKTSPAVDSGASEATPAPQRLVADRRVRVGAGRRFEVSEQARLLLKAPSVVVLDEATAHLDSESEAAIQRALKTALAGRTSLVIAHRLSTVRAADQILVIAGGQIAGRGTHDELLAAGGVYAGLYRTQFAPQAALRSFLEKCSISG
jgi:ABC-type uncharacterized transport system ATPase subunit